MRCFMYCTSHCFSVYYFKFFGIIVFSHLKLSAHTSFISACYINTGTQGVTNVGRKFGGNICAMHVNAVRQALKHLPHHINRTSPNLWVTTHYRHTGSKRAINAEYNKLCSLWDDGKIAVCKCVVSPVREHKGGEEILIKKLNK